MKQPEPLVESAIDAVCLLGCDVVSAYIEALRNQEERPEYRGLNREQRDELLRYLESVMAVYAER